MNTLVSLKSTWLVNNNDIFEEVGNTDTIKDLFLLVYRYWIIDTFIAMIEFEKIMATKKQEIEEILEIKVWEVRAVPSFMEEDNISTLSKNSRIIVRYDLVTPNTDTYRLIWEIKLSIKYILLKISSQLPQDLSWILSGTKEQIAGKLLPYVLKNEDVFTCDNELAEDFDIQLKVIKKVFF